jgi:hypothetical protein
MASQGVLSMLLWERLEAASLPQAFSGCFDVVLIPARRDSDLLSIGQVREIEERETSCRVPRAHWVRTRYLLGLVTFIVE